MTERETEALHGVSTFGHGRLDPDVQIRSPLSLNDAVEALRNALSDPASFREEVLPTKVQLNGNVEPEKLTLHRDRGGRQFYLCLVGRLIAEGDHTLLQGKIMPHPPIFIGLFVSFMFLFSALAIFVSVVAWQWPQSLIVMAVGVVVTLLGVAVIRFRGMNVRAEAELLVKDVERILRGRAV